jgi:hypothetical protein
MRQPLEWMFPAWQDRKTKAERDQEWADAERRVWREFRPKLAALKSRADARLLVNRTVPLESPGRRYYSNLAFLLNSGFTVVPFGSSYDEKILYLKFIQSLDASELPPKTAEKIQVALRRAIIK